MFNSKAEKLVKEKYENVSDEFWTHGYVDIYVVQLKETQLSQNIQLNTQGINRGVQFYFIFVVLFTSTMSLYVAYSLHRNPKTLNVSNFLSTGQYIILSYDVLYSHYYPSFEIINNLYLTRQSSIMYIANFTDIAC